MLAASMLLISRRDFAHRQSIFWLSIERSGILRSEGTCRRDKKSRSGKSGV